KGTIKLNGTDTHDLNAKKEILYLPSDDILPEFLTGREYIKLMLKMYSAVMDERKLSQLAKYYDFESALDVLIEEYSNGMKKKIQLIVSMLISPKVLIIDETLNGMDVESTEITKLLLSNFIRPEKIVIMCSHDLHLLEEVCNKVVILYGGKIHTKENIEDIQKTTSLLSVFKKIINHDELKEAINKFQDNGEKYHEIKPIKHMIQLYSTFFVRRILNFGVLKNPIIRILLFIAFFLLMTVITFSIFMFFSETVQTEEIVQFLLNTYSSTIILWTIVVTIILKVIFSKVDGFLTMTTNFPVSIKERNFSVFLYETLISFVVIFLLS